MSRRLVPLLATWLVSTLLLCSPAVMAFRKNAVEATPRKSGQGTSYLQETLPDVPWGKRVGRRSCGKTFESQAV